MSYAAAASLRVATADDAAALAGIYNHYVRESVATFEEAEVSAEVLLDRVQKTFELSLPWLVVERANVIVGYAYARPWRERSAYRYSVETTVYLAPNATGQGLGRQLYTELLGRLRSASLRTAIAGISLPNPASIALHERFGFKPASRFEQLGFKLGRWIDVAHWQLLL